MKKTLRTIALAALVISPFSQVVSAESFSATADGYTAGVRPAQLAKVSNVQTAQIGRSSVPHAVPGENPSSDVDFLALAAWVRVVIFTFPRI